MPYERTRNLDPEFVKLVVPLLPVKGDSNGTFQVEKPRTSMAAMSSAKARALNGPWKHLLDDVSIENIHISMRDGHEAELRIIKPKNFSGSLPVLNSLHGGGFVAGNNDTEELINRQLALECQLVVFSLEYRLAPEHEVTSTIFNDAEDAVKWVVEHAPQYGGDVKKGLFLSGTSVGATMSVMLAFRAKSLGISFKGMVLRQGAFMFGDSARDEWKPRLKSLEENADSPLLGAAEVVQITKLMGISPEQARDPWNFPMFAGREDLSRLPRAYMVGAGCDPVIDDVVLFRDLLEEAGVETRLKIYEGMPHGFHAFHSLTAALAEMKETAEGTKWLINSAKA